jgi:hypothetical protein
VYYNEAVKRFDFNKFLNSVQELDFIDLMGRINAEVRRAKNITIRRRSDPAREIQHQQQNYISLLKGLGFLLYHGMQPAGVNDQDFLLYLPLIKRLVEKGQLTSGILLLFNQPD